MLPGVTATRFPVTAIAPDGTPPDPATANVRGVPVRNDLGDFLGAPGERYGMYLMCLVCLGCLVCFRA